MKEGPVLDSVDPYFGFNNQSEQRVPILSLDSFTPAFVDPNRTKEETSRRFMTFFLENENQYSTSMVLRKAYNTLNECCALKSPLFYEDGIEAMEYKNPPRNAAKIRRGSKKAYSGRISQFIGGFTLKGVSPRVWARARQGQASHRQGIR